MARRLLGHSDELGHQLLSGSSNSRCIMLSTEHVPRYELSLC